MAAAADVRYGVDDRPPLGLSVLLAVQLTFGVALPLVYPVVVFRAAGLPLGEIPSLLSWGLFALAAATLLQAARGPVGTGHLVPPLNSALYLQPSVAAITIGGRSLLAGMTVIAGLSEVAFSRFVTQLRRLFPPVVTGLIVFLVGAEVGIEAVRLGVDAVRESEASNVAEGAISAVTFLTIVGGVVWGSLWVRNMAPILGIALGTALSVVFVRIPRTDREFIGSTDLVGLPDAPDFDYAVEGALIIPFLVLGLAAGLRTIGVIMTIHEASHPGTRSTDHAKVEHGVRADGVGAAISGAVGMPGISAAPSAVGVQVAAGIMSRSVATWLAGALVVLAFLPRVLAYLVTAPAAVVSALLAYYASFMMIGGLKLTFRQRIDTRATFIFGGAISLALGARIYGAGAAESNGRDWVALITGSMVTVGVLAALALTVLFRLGQRRRRTFVLQVEDGRVSTEALSAVAGALDDLDVGLEGAQPGETTAAIVREVVDRGLADGDIAASVSSDGLELRIDLRYAGRPLGLEPLRPLADDDLTDENVFSAGLARYLDVPRPDDMTVRTSGVDVELRLIYELV